MQSRKSTLILISAFAAAAALAGLAGVRTAPSDDLLDPRRSIYLAGPNGAKGFAQAMEGLGVTVEVRRRSLFDLRQDSAEVLPLLALLDVAALPTRVERAELARYVMRGGSLLLAGRNGVERCFGATIDFRRDSVALAIDDSLSMPQTTAVITSPEESDEEVEGASLEGSIPCATPPPEYVDTLMVTVEGEVVASRLEFSGGGSVFMLADSRFLSNEILRETDAGLVIIRWLLEHGRDPIIVDEYHQGFDEGGSILLAACNWTLASPGGWALLQLAVAGLLALVIGAIRFGPAISVVERRRRSVLEHLDALAVGLQRAGGQDVAAELIVGGLRRRLTTKGLVRRPAGKKLESWLGSLALAARTDDARSSVRRLGLALEERGGNERVLNIATTVEDVWEALRPAGRSRRS